MKQSSKYTFVNNSIQRNSPARPEISAFNSNPSFQSRIQTSSVTSSYGLRSQKNVKPEPITSHTLASNDQQKLMMRYIVVCMELERVNRLLDRNRIAKYNEEQAVREMRAEFQAIKLREAAQLREIAALREEVAAFHLKIRHFEQTAKEKDRIITQKQEELRAGRLELAGLNLSHSRLEHNQKNRIRELEGELVFQRNRISDLNRRKDDLQDKLKSISHKEQNLITALATQQAKTRGLEEQLQNLRALRTRSESQNEITAQATASLRRENAELLKKLEQLKLQTERANELQRRLRQVESQNSDNAQKYSSANARIKTLEGELSTAILQLKAAKSNQGEALRKQFASLQNKLQSIGSNITGRESAEREREIQQITRQRDLLSSKVQQLIAEISKLQRLLASRDEDCKGCSRLTSENGLLSRKLGALQQSLRERQLQIQRLSMKTQVKVQKQGQKMSVKDLLLSAQQLKGSNERMSRLIESSQDIQGRSLTKVTSTRLIAMKMYDQQ